MQTNSPTTRLTRGHGQQILLVEDNPAVLRTIDVMLKNLGYDVTTAVDGYAALDTFREETGQIDVVITDITMPEMDGYALIESIIQQDNSVRFIAMSGYPLDQNYADWLEKHRVAWLEKPIRLRTLAEILQQVLQKS